MIRNGHPALDENHGSLGLMDRGAPESPDEFAVGPAAPDPDESHFAAIEPEAGEVSELLQNVRQQLTRQRLPVAIYRLQFTGDFTFRKAAELVDYLDALGITDIYASPLL